MAEPPDHVSGAAGRGGLRASHADRERVIDTLKAAFVLGMLTKDEFDLRVSQAFASRTGAELAAFVADLPAGLATAQPPRPAPAQGQARVLRFGAVIAVATMLYAAVWPLALLLPTNSEGEPQAAVRLLVMTTFAYLMISVLAGLQLLEARQDKRSGARPPRRRLPGAGRYGIQSARHSHPVGGTRTRDRASVALAPPYQPSVPSHKAWMPRSAAPAAWMWLPRRIRRAGSSDA